MAGTTYLDNAAGTLTQKRATQTSAGAGDAGKIPALDAAGKLDTTMMPVGIAADVAVVTASEALSAGDFVNVWDSAGTFKVRKADASVAGKEAHGFVIAAVSSAAPATVYFEGTNASVTGQTAGVVYLSPTVPGGATTTPSSGVSQVVQRIGYATSATAINFQSQPPIILAAT